MTPLRNTIVLIPFMSGKIGYDLEETVSEYPAVLIPFMSGKIGYPYFIDKSLTAFCLNPFYVREDWLPV